MKKKRVRRGAIEQLLSFLLSRKGSEWFGGGGGKKRKVLVKDKVGKEGGILFTATTWKFFSVTLF